MRSVHDAKVDGGQRVPRTNRPSAGRPVADRTTDDAQVLDTVRDLA